MVVCSLIHIQILSLVPRAFLFGPGSNLGSHIALSGHVSLVFFDSEKFLSLFKNLLGKYIIEVKSTG